jgi:lysophospholipase L1-like esterase
MIYNVSISGGTTETILERFEREARVREADALIFQTGGNDVSRDGKTKKHQVSPEQFEKNLEEIIKGAKAITSNIIFVGFKNCDESKTTPVSWRNINYLNEDIKQYNGIMQNVCVRHRISYINVFGLLENSDLEDGLHPNARGHEKLYSAIKQELVVKKWI